jgi:uncharacterized membrane protein YjjP (DUF1212 family)
MAFLAAMARSLSRYGETCDDIEDGLAACAGALGIPAQFSATPTMVLMSLGAAGLERTTMMRIEESRIDLRGLSMVRAVLHDVTTGGKTPDLALAELRLIEASPSWYAWPLRVAGSALGAAALAVLLGGGPREFAVAAPVGLAVGALFVLGQRYRRLSLLTEVLCGFAGAAATLLAGHLVGDFRMATVALAAVILLLPGMAIAMGVAELTSRHLTAGTARLAGATITLMNLSIGSLLGFALFERLDAVPRPGPATQAQTPALLVVAALAISCSLLVSTRARLWDAPLVLATVVLALASARLGAWLTDPTLGVAIASLCVGLAGNAFERITHRAAALVLIPGVMVLVPGALGLRGVYDFMRTAEGGMEVFANVLIIAAGIVVGLAVANSALPGRRHEPRPGAD